jgi:hypothetical protein
MSLGIGALLIFVLIGILLAMRGAELIKRGVQSSRIGYEPSCRACGYNLTGIQSQRCPECGSILSPLSILSGRKQRQFGLMLAGIAMLLLGLCPLAAMIPGVIPDIDWYHHKPTLLGMRIGRCWNLR